MNVEFQLEEVRITLSDGITVFIFMCVLFPAQRRYNRQTIKMYDMVSNITNTNRTKIWESAVPPALQFAFGVIGNLIALIVLCSSAKRHKWRPFYRLVGGLAVTDMCGVLFVYPLVMVRYATDFTYDFPPPLCSYISFVFSYGLLGSAFIVCAMSLDRFLAILFPFVYNTDTKIRRVNITLGTIWITTGLICGLHIFGLGSSHSFYPGSWCFLNFVNDEIKDRINSFIYSITGLLILLTTIILNTIVIISLCKRMRNDNIYKTKRRGKKNDIYIIIFLLVIVTVFGVCWSPLMINIMGHATLIIRTDGPLELLVLRMAVTNSVVDPWIYILLRKETVLAVRSTIRKCKRYYGIPTDSRSVGRSQELSDSNMYKVKLDRDVTATSSSNVYV